MSGLLSKDELKAYILRQLGDGVHNVELTSGQLDDCIENAIGYYEREVDGGVEDKMYIIDLMEGVREYVLDREVMGVSELYGTSFVKSQDLFSQMNQVRMDMAQTLTLGGTSIQSYVTTMMYFEFMNQFLGTQSTFNFNPVTKKLIIGEDVVSDGVIALSVLWSTRNSIEMWNNNFIKEYSTALAMRQWGINMSKYNNATLVGGMELNGAGMLELANSEIERLRNELLDKETSPLGIWVG